MATCAFRLGSDRRRPRAASVAALVLSLAAGAARAGYALGREAALRIEVTPLIVESGVTRSIEPLAVEATRDEAGILETSLAWSPSGPPLALTLEIAVGEGTGDGGHALRLAATLRMEGSPPIRSSRVLTLAEGSAGLFDVLEEGNRRLVLSIRAEETVRPVVQGRRKVGSPVLFQLAVERRDGERSVLLETDRLVTFLHEGVEYAFSRGEEDRRESLRLVLTPLRLEGDLVELEADVTGSLPGNEGPHVLSRTVRILASRRATSSLDVTVGDPPAGYRFLITPDF
jgi:hypothetical protein